LERVQGASPEGLHRRALCPSKVRRRFLARDAPFAPAKYAVASLLAITQVRCGSMVGSRFGRGLWALLLLALMSCGGRATSDPAQTPALPAGTGGATGADATINTCGGVADGGCAGEGGERPLEPYARLRPACSLSVQINRRGTPVSIDCHIQ